MLVFPKWSEVTVTQLCWLFEIPWTVACQVPLSMGLSRQEYYSGLPFRSLGDLSNPEIEPRSPALQVDSLLYEPPVFYRQVFILEFYKCFVPFLKTNKQTKKPPQIPNLMFFTSVYFFHLLHTLLFFFLKCEAFGIRIFLLFLVPKTHTLKDLFAFLLGDWVQWQCFSPGDVFISFIYVFPGTQDTKIFNIQHSFNTANSSNRSRTGEMKKEREHFSFL